MVVVAMKEIPAKMRAPRIDRTRRAEIGAEKRSKRRVVLLDVARELFGKESGRTTRVEDVCEAASIARGTFYNYFPSIDVLQAELFEDLSMRFDQAVHIAFEQLGTPSERTCAAIRYYLHHVVEDRQWGWGMVNTGMGIGLFRNAVSERVVASIQEGIEAGEFSIATAEAGRDILLGAGLASAITLLNGQAGMSHIEDVAASVLQALGVLPSHAQKLVRLPIASLLPMAGYVNEQ